MKGKMKYYEPVAYFTSRLMYSLNSYANKNGKFCKENGKVLHRGAKLFYSCLLPYERAVGKLFYYLLLFLLVKTMKLLDHGQEEERKGKSMKIHLNFL